MRNWKTILTLTVLAVLFAAATYAQKKQNGFSVILFLGESQANPGGDTLPLANPVRKAIADLKDFLPYRNYRVLDTQWLRSGSTRMKGLDDQEYEVVVEAGEFTRVGADLRPFDPSSGRDGVIVVNFHLQEAGAAANSSEEFGRSVQVANLERELQSAKARIAMPQSDEMKKVIAADIARTEKMIRLARARKLIDSHFEMAFGETVVVGTSKIGGDKGLIVLLSSVTAGGK
jgi:hypothetical protein